MEAITTEEGTVKGKIKEKCRSKRSPEKDEFRDKDEMTQTRDFCFLFFFLRAAALSLKETSAIAG